MRHLTVKQIAFKEAFCSNGGNGLQAAKTAGYKGNDNTMGQRAHELVNNSKVKAAIFEYKAILAKKLDHNRQIAIDMLVGDFKSLANLAKGGNVQAIQARTSITRELNAISNLHATTIVSEVKPPELSDGEREALQSVAKDFKARLVKVS